jgi:tetratricopeptide (TPR) repeat protein
MPKLRIKGLTILCGVVFAGGCGSLKQMTRAEAPVVPVSKVTNSTSVVDPDYQIGRAYQGRRQYEAAIAAYRKSLEANPGNAEAHNALGVIYATLGKHEQAVAELTAALALAPSAAHIHNNVGYAYFLRGRNLDAAAALELATALDPANQRSRENMRMVETALALTQESRPVVPALEAQGKLAVPGNNPDASLPHLITVAPNVFALRQGAATAVKTNVLVTPIHPMVAKVEVTNGSGVAGLARRTASSLQTRGYAVGGVMNKIPYTQLVTEIRYRPGAESQANELNALLLQPAKLVQSSRLRPNVGMRVVLGRDMGEEMIFADTPRGGRAVAGL